MPMLETERLVGEPASEVAHREIAVELFGDPRVAEWIWPGERGGPRTARQAETILARFERGWVEHGIGWWYLRERDSGAYVGEVGLQRTTVAGAPAVEIGWTLLPRHWGRGYATEAAHTALAFGFGPAGLAEIVAFTLPHNGASRRVMERIGMTYDREFVHAGLPHVLYRLAKPRFSPPSDSPSAETPE